MQSFDTLDASPGISSPSVPVWWRLLAVWGVLFGMLQVVSAQTYGTYGNLTYWDDGAEITITGHVHGPIGDLVIPEAIAGKPVTSIGDEAFFRRSPTSLSIPNSVTSIGKSAFLGCDSLTSLTIPNSVTSIGDYAFAVCRGLTSLSIPDSITSIGFSVFGGCSALTSLSIPDSVTVIGIKAFAGCSALTSLTIPNSVTMIGEIAFEGCNSLNSVTIPGSVNYIGNRAFKNCSSLREVEFLGDAPFMGDEVFDLASPDFGICFQGDGFTSPTWYGYAAVSCVPSDPLPELTSGNFRYLDHGTEVTITGYASSLEGALIIPEIIDGKPVTMIGDYAFVNCSQMEFLSIPDSVTFIGNFAFAGCNRLLSLSIPDSVTWLGDHAFAGCNSLTSLVIGNGVTSIGGWAFLHCNALSAVEIGNSVTSIGKYAFYEGTCLTAISIPASVTSIGDRAFEKSSHLSVVQFMGDAPDMGERVFFETSSELTLYYLGEGFDSPTWYGYPAVLGVSPTPMPIPILILYSGNLRYLDEGTEIKISGYFSKPVGDFVIPETIGGKPVAAIGRYAFSGCHDITSLILPDSVKSIEEGAFAGCWGLASVSIGGGVLIGNSAFVECWSLTTVSIGDGITSITNYAFSGCSALAVVSIGNGGTSIVNSAFNLCYSLESLSIGDGGVAIGGEVFNRCWSLVTVSIGGGGVIIGDGAFKECWELTEISIGDGGVTIGDEAFKECWKLTTVSIGDGISSMGDYAFASCVSLTSVSMPQSLVAIGNWTFASCHSLISVSIPDSVTSIGNCAFLDCSSLTSLTIPSSVAYIGDSAFANCGFLTSVSIPQSLVAIGNWTFAGCGSLTSVSISDSVTSIGSGAFWGCGSLTSLTIPSSVTYIGDYAFANCLSLTSFSIPQSLTSIGNWIFAGCSSLASISIPDSVTFIGDYAFYECPSLNSVSIGRGVTSIGDYAFSACSKLRVVQFFGEAPSMGEEVFDFAGPDFTIYYLGSGFTSPTWYGYPTISGLMPAINALRITLEGGGKIGPNIQGKKLQIGAEYTITAIPDKGMIFKEWRQGGEVVSTNAKLTFTMEEWLRLTPVFIETPFPDVAGTYNGLFLPEEDVENASDFLEQTGFASLLLNSKGAFSGTLFHKGVRFAIRGQFDFDGETLVTIKRGDGSDLVMSLALDFDQKQLHAQLGDDLFLQAGCSAYSGRGSGLHPLAKTRYTAVLPSSIANSSMGYGFVLLQVDAKGRAKLTGKLADGTPLAASVYLGPSAGGDSWKLPVFLSLYPGAIGLLAGEAEISGEQLKSLEGGLGWYRPPDVPKSSLLPEGYFGELVVLGGRYEKPARGEYYLQGDAYGGFYLDVMGGSTYPQKERKQGYWDFKNSPRLFAPRSSGWSFKYIAPTGLLRGTVPETVDGKTRALKFEGVVVPRIDVLTLSVREVVRGAGFFTTKAESGSIEVIARK